MSIGLSSSNPSEGTVSPATLTFTAANWNQVQTVTATGIDDLVDDGDVAYNIITAAPISSDLVYSAINPVDVSLFNIDNDGAGVTVTRQGSSTDSANTSEVGDVVTFTLALNSQPSANVSIGLSSSDSSEGTINTATLTFTNANWNQSQTITATGVDDFVVDGNVSYLLLLAAATSTDPNYDGENPADQPLTNLDNDGAGITVTPTSGLITSESGGAANFSVVLNSQPSANVSILLSSSDSSEGTVSPATLIFTAANWNEPQTATATGVDDDGDDNNTNYTIVTAAASSTDDTYSGLDAADVEAINIDNDTAGIIISPTSGMFTTEAGGTATFSVVLESQPSADVNIFLSSSNITEGTINPISLRFTASNWNTPQTLIVTGQADDENDGNVSYSILTTVSSSDSNYSAINPADVSLTNIRVVYQLYLPMIFR